MAMSENTKGFFSANTSVPFAVAAQFGVAPWADSLELAVIFSLEGYVIREVNRAFARKFGQPAPTWIGRTVPELVHPEDVAAWREAGGRVERPPYHISREQRWQTAQGWRWISWEETALRNEDGVPVAVRAIGRDVTKHRLAEEHFRKLAQAVEQAPVSIAITTPGGTPQYVNSRYTEVTGYTLEEIFERQIPLLREGHPSEAAYRRFCAVVAAGHKWSGELCSRRKDGGEVWELVQVAPIRDHLDQIAYLFCLREDISERKVLEEQLRQAQKLESLGTLAGGIAHDFNNIISIIRGFTELAISLPRGDAHLPRYLEAVSAAALRASALVGQIRSFGVKHPVAYRSTQLNAVVQELGGLIQETFPRGIELKLLMDASLESFAADPDQVRQVLLNLCVNARDAMPGGGSLTIATSRVPGRIQTAIGLDPTLDYACLRVTDTGTGMPPDVKARVFEPFFSTKQENGGTGLGLAMAYGIVRNHQGVIDLQSEVGVGTEFCVYLPMRARAEEETVSSGAGVGTGMPAGSECILLVEDELPIQDMLGVIMRRSGYTVHSAMDGADAIECMLRTEGKVDLMILDLNMPRMGGIEVLQVLRERWPRVPVLVISGNLSAAAVKELDQIGHRNVLPKPFELGDFGRVVRELLDASKADASGGGSSPVASGAAAAPSAPMPLRDAD